MVEIIVALITLAGTIVGGGIIFYKQNKKLKEMDVKYRNAEAKGLEAQTNGQVVNNENSAAEFWKKSSISLQDEVNDLRRQAKALAQEIQSDRPSLKEKGNQGNSGR